MSQNQSTLDHKSLSLKLDPEQIRLLGQFGTELQRLFDHRSPSESSVFSVYLDIDQSKSVNLNRRFEVPLKNAIRSILDQISSKTERAQFEADSNSVLKFLAEFEPSGKGVALFSDHSENFFWSRVFHVPVRNQFRWNGAPHTRPILEMTDEYERYGVVLTDRMRARLFTVFMGEIEEHEDAFASSSVRQIKETGTDHIWSESNFQRSADEHARWHLKFTAGLMDQIYNQNRFDRLLIAGPEEAMAELHRMLSKRLQSKVMEHIRMPIQISQKEVLESIVGVEQRLEREGELKLVEQLIVNAAKGASAVIGLQPTLLAVHQASVKKLVYAETYSLPGSQCTNCSSLMEGQLDHCSFCAQQTKPVEDLTEAMIERVVAASGKFEQVKGDAASKLRDAGSIGALLKY